MKSPFFLLCLISITTYSVFGQSTRWIREGEIGNFRSAASFSLSPEGYFFVADAGASQVLKLNKDGAVFNTAGGYGWDASGLTTPVDICAEAVYVLVADEENNKINKYDKNLNLAGTVYKRESLFTEEIFGYPRSVAVSSLGDLYVLDGENNRIVYYSFFGDYKGNFGGFNSGFYTLDKPRRLTALKNSIAVLDHYDLVIFDLFGSYVQKYSFKERFNSVKSFEGVVTLTSDRDIYASTDGFDLEFTRLETDEHLYFIDSILTGDKLYILTENSIVIYRKVVE